MSTMRLIHVAALTACVVSAGCARAPREPASVGASVASAPDSIQGRVVRVGPDPVGWWAIVVTPDTQVRVSGEASAPLCSVSGAVVLARGARADGSFNVVSFAVRSVNDQPVDDGVVVVTGSAVALRLPNGTQRAVPNAPPNLRTLNGQRIWVTRPVDGVAPSFGVIAGGC